MKRKVVVKVTDDELESLKNMLKVLKESSQKIEINSLRYGSLGNHTLVSFNVDEENYDLVSENLTLRGLKLLLPESTERRKQVRLLNEEPGKQNYSQLRDRKISGRDTPSVLLDSAIKQGDYEKVIQLSKDFRIGFDLIKKAKDNIETAIKAAIDDAFNKGLKSIFDIDNSINILLKIAGDKNVKAFNKHDLQKLAGLRAIDLCQSNIEQNNNLIKICNNNLVPSIICIKAAARFYDILQSIPEKAEEEISYASKHLNIRWLRIALDIAIPETPKDEVESVINLIELIQSRQSK